MSASRQTPLALVFIGLFIVSLAYLPQSSSQVTAASGDILRTINVTPAPSCSLSVGVAFDGTELLTSCYSNQSITRVNPTNGAYLGIYTVTDIADGIGAISWDAKNQRLWIGSWSTGAVYYATLDKTTNQAYATFAFDSGIPSKDGLAFDGSDDSIWLSGDVQSIIYHYSLTGSLLGTIDISNKLGGCGNSGITVADASTLYLANNGCEQIYAAKKDGSDTSFFASLSGKRVEDLECDNVTFPDKSVIWSKDAYDYELNAFEVPTGQCAQGGVVQPPLIVIPGIAGSTIGNNNGAVWPQAQQAFYSRDDNYLLQLRLDEESDKPYDNNTPSLRPIDVIRRAPVTVLGQTEEHRVYEVTIEELEKGGYYKEGENLFVFPYDWRKDARIAASELITKIDAVLNKTKAKQVDILAHSMGGIVTRVALTNPASKGKVRKVLTLGTPILGATKALGVLEYQMPCFIDLPWLAEAITGGGCLHNPATLQQTVNNHLGVYELLPSRKFSEAQVSPYILDPVIGDEVPQTYEQWTAIVKADHNSKLMERADTFHQEFDNWKPADSSVQYMRIVGTGLPTTGSIVRHQLCYLQGLLRNICNPGYQTIRTTDGDGTVPGHSADVYKNTGFDLRGGYPNRYVRGIEHGQLASTVAVLNFARAYFGLNDNTSSSAQSFSQIHLPTPRNSREASNPPDLYDEPQPFDGTEIEFYGGITGNISDGQGNISGDDPQAPGLRILQAIPGSIYESIGSSQHYYVTETGVYSGTFTVTENEPIRMWIRTYTDATLNGQAVLTIDAPIGSRVVFYFNANQDLSAIQVNVDSTNDGQIDTVLAPETIVTGSTAKDSQPPVSAATVEKLGLQTTVKLTAVDQPASGAGTKATYYRIIGIHTTFQVYNGPFSTPAGSSVEFLSVDLAGNTEASQLLQVDSLFNVALPLVIN